MSPMRLQLMGDIGRVTRDLGSFSQRLLAVPAVASQRHLLPRNSKSGHQLIQNNQGGMLSLSPGWRAVSATCSVLMCGQCLSR